MQHLPDYDVDLVHSPMIYTPITICTKGDKKIVYDLKHGHRRIVFARHEDTLFIAEFSIAEFGPPISSGCEVVAIDLPTGKRRWRSPLQAIGPARSNYCIGRLNIDTDGVKVAVYGNESHGKYVEQLDANSGKVLVNVKYDQ